MILWNGCKGYMSSKLTKQMKKKLSRIIKYKGSIYKEKICKPQTVRAYKDLGQI